MTSPNETEIGVVEFTEFELVVLDQPDRFRFEWRTVEGDVFDVPVVGDA